MDAGKEVRSPRKEGARRDSVGWRETRRQTHQMEALRTTSTHFKMICFACYRTYSLS